MDIEEEAVFSGIGVDITRRDRGVQQVLFPRIQGEWDIRVRVFSHGHVSFRLPIRAALRADLRLSADLDDAPVGLRVDGASETEISLGLLRVSNVLELVDVGFIIVPKGLVQFLCKSFSYDTSI